MMHDQALYDRLLTKVRKDESGCWLWTGYAYTERKYAAHRYGSICLKINGTWTNRATHRAMWGAVHGWPESTKICVCHRCDVPLCINPDHLFLGTHTDNMQDSKQKGRHFLNSKTICTRGHLLEGENVYRDRKGCRHCKACHVIRVRLKRGWPADLAHTTPLGARGWVPPEVAAYRRTVKESAGDKS